VTPWLIAAGFFGASIVFFGALLIRAIVADLRPRGEVAEHLDIAEERPARGRLYMTRAATNRVLIPHERDCQDLPTWERLAALYLVPEGEKA
jgi:hypothetical protein